MGLPEVIVILFVILLYVIGVFVYVIPTVIAAKKRKHDQTSIVLINLLLGWTVVGWIVALVMAIRPAKDVSKAEGATVTNQETAPDSDDEAIYATALSEIQSGSVRPGVWAKAIAGSEGDENKCKALYIGLRVQHEKDRIQQEHHSSHMAAVEASRLRQTAFQDVIANLFSRGYKAKRTMSGWTIREPLGGRVEVNSDQALLDYAQGRRVEIPPELASKQSTGNQSVATEAINSSLRSRTTSAANLASLGDRLVGQFLDSIVAIVAIVVSLIPFAVSETLGRITLVCGILFALFYILFADGFRNGQSYGKKIMKTAVVDATTGEPCTFGKSFVRNLLLSILGVIDWVFIFGRKRQRLGDKAANTIVIEIGQA